MIELRLILGDQLNIKHSWFERPSKAVRYVMIESADELQYVPHHWQKATGFLAAMRAFASEIEAQGHQVTYLAVSRDAQKDSIVEEVKSLISSLGVTKFSYQRPDESRLMGQLRAANFGVPVNEVDTEHFLLSFDELMTRFKPTTAHRMEAFYRWMRKRTGYLMLGDEPEGGAWNFDADNRSRIPAGLERPKPLRFTNDVSDVVDDLKATGGEFFGASKNQLLWPITREQSLKLLDDFCCRLLPLFGTYQDAMSDECPEDWTLFHSRLSFSLNTKLISPREVIERALQERDKRPDLIALNQLEGFVRQILGWREFVRGIYWANHDGYTKRNQLNHEAPLPDFFWSAKTQMNCVAKSVQQTIDYSYAHHIQRLMILGNLSNLLGVNPDYVHQWFLAVYMDAIEWVEAPNVIGMALSADGGLIASKPYVSSANYINKMSNYCKNCRYQPTKKTGEGACPFNALYWEFLDRHRQTYQNNPRMSFAYRNLEKMDPAQKEALLAYAQQLRAHSNQL